MNFLSISISFRCLEKHGKEVFLFLLPQSLRARPLDMGGNADDIDGSIGIHPKGSLSHSGTLKGLKKAHREIVLYVNDLEREGLKVRSFVLMVRSLSVLLC